MDSSCSFDNELEHTVRTLIDWDEGEPDSGFYPASWELRLLVLGVDKRTVFSYWDVLEEGRQVFLKRLASSSSFLQGNGRHYHDHYTLEQKIVLSQKKKEEMMMKGRGVRTMAECQSSADDGGTSGKCTRKNI